VGRVVQAAVGVLLDDADGLGHAALRETNRDYNLLILLGRFNPPGGVQTDIGALHQITLDLSGHRPYNWFCAVQQRWFRQAPTVSEFPAGGSKAAPEIRTR